MNQHEQRIRLQRLTMVEHLVRLATAFRTRREFSYGGVRNAPTTYGFEKMHPLYRGEE
jgi:hypothetical protein